MKVDPFYFLKNALTGDLSDLVSWEDGEPLAAGSDEMLERLLDTCTQDDTAAHNP